MTVDQPILPLHSGAGEKVVELATPVLSSMGLALVQVDINRHMGKRTSVLIVAEHIDGRPVDLATCATINRTMSRLLDVENVFQDAYYLEVSSAGIDRLLVRHRDFEKARGHRVKIKLKEKTDNRSRMAGALKDVTHTTVTVDVDGKECIVPFARMEKAKLVLTDDLIKSTVPTDKH